MKNLFRFTLLIIIALAISLTFITPAFAIANPDTLQVDAVYAYHNLTEYGDQLYLIEYYNHYATIPTETVSQAFVVNLYAINGTTILKSTIPYAYYRKGYDRGYASIYFTAAQAVVLTWGAAYTVKMLGTVPPFAIAPSSAAKTIDYWSTFTSPWDCHKELAARIIYSAYILNTSWNIATTQSLTSETTAGTKLSTYGEAYFGNVIVDLKLMASQAFYAYASTPDNYKVDYQGHNYNVYNTGTATFTKGSATVVGVATVWTNAMVGREIKPVSEDSWWVITGWTNGTTITIASAFPYATQTNALYIIGTTHAKSLTTGLFGTPFDFSSLASKLGMSLGWFNALLVMSVIAAGDFVLIKYGGSYKGVTFIDGIACTLAAASGMFPLVGAVAFATISVLLFLYTMFYNKATA